MSHSDGTVVTRSKAQAAAKSQGLANASEHPTKAKSPIPNKMGEPGGTLTPEMLTKALESLKESVFAKIESANKDLHAEIKSVKHELGASIDGLQTTLSAHDGRLTELEKSATFNGDNVAELQTTVDRLKEAVLRLEARCDDEESRNRRNNLLLSGVSEGLELNQPTQFVSELLKEVFQLSEAPLLDRAHRSLRPKPNPGNPPRIFIMRVHYTRDRDEMLRKANQGGPFSYKGNKLSLWPDYTKSVREKRSAFKEVRQKVKKINGAETKLYFPATLRISLPGEPQHSFTDASRALEFVNGWSPRSPSTRPHHQWINSLPRRS